MKNKVTKDKGYSEAILNGNCGTAKFYEIANILESKLNLIFTEKINDLDSFYWDFKYEKIGLTLHYNNYFGVSIFPKALKNATELENKKVIEISSLLFNSL